jgi:tetratricopeptide (TPR) repeat protein
VNQATILYKKGLYEHAVIHYEKALRMALDAEELEVALEIYTCLLDIYFVGSMGVKFPYEEEMKVLSKKLNNEHLIAQLHTKVAEKMFSDDFNSEPEQVQSIHDILNAPLLQKINENDSFFAQWGKMCIHTHSYYLLRQHDDADIMKEKHCSFCATIHT